MKENINERIQIACDEIRACRTQEGDAKLLRTLTVLVNLMICAREKGLLALEAISSGYDYPEWKVLEIPGAEMMIRLVVDGTDPDDIEELALAYYASRRYKGYEALQFLLALRGLLMVQAGECVYVVERVLISMLPIDLANHEVEILMPARQLDQEKLVTEWESTDSRALCELVNLVCTQLPIRELRSVIVGKSAIDLGYLLAALTEENRMRLLEATTERQRKYVKYYMEKALDSKYQEFMVDSMRGFMESIRNERWILYNIKHMDLIIEVYEQILKVASEKQERASKKNTLLQELYGKRR